MAPFTSQQSSPQMSTATDRSQKQKDRALTALNKLGDRDTQKNAINELTFMTREADADSVSTLVSCICSGGPERKVSARKESVRLLAELCTPNCPAYQTVLQRPLLPKVITFLKARFKDTDTSVREVTANAFGLIASHLAAIQSPSSTGDTSSNPVLRAIFESLGAREKEVNMSASQALARVVDSTPPITAALWKQLLRWLNTPFAEGNQYLIAAIANLGPDNSQPCGLIMGGYDSVIHFLTAIVGSATTPTSGGSGLAAALSSSEWPTRRAAAEALQAVAMAFGPAMDTDPPKNLAKSDEMAKPSSLRATSALSGNCRYDKIRIVRAATNEAAAVYQSLQEFRQSERDIQQWPDFCAGRIAAGKENVSQSPGMSREKLMASGSGVAASPGTAGLSRTGSDGHASNSSGTRMSTSRSGTTPGMSSQAVQTPDGLRPAWSNNVTRGEPSQRGPAQGVPQFDNLDSASAASDREAVPSSIFAASRKLQGGEAGPMSPFPTQATAEMDVMAGMQQQAGQQSSSPGAPLYGGDSPTPALQDTAGQMSASASPLTMPAHQFPARSQQIHTHPSLAPVTPSIHNDSDGRAAWLEQTVQDMQANMEAMSRRMEDLEALVHQLQHQPPSGPVMPQANGNEPHGNGPMVSLEDGFARSMPTPNPGHVSTSYLPTPLASSQPMYASTPSGFQIPADLPKTSDGSPDLRASMAQLELEHRLSSANQLHQAPVDVSSYGRGSVALDDGYPGANEGSVEGFSSVKINSMYRDALQDPSSGGLSLLRLMAKTGPVWGELDNSTAKVLVGRLQDLLTTHKALPRLLPWLWPLADEKETGFSVPTELRGPLVDTLANIPRTEDTGLGNKVSLLLSALRAEWNLKTTRPSLPQSSPLNSPLSSGLFSSTNGSLMRPTTPSLRESMAI
ncbi:hypothetical protein WJX74_009868 [Apatococcus lobatus]|uniref:TORTIFOLIA1/SINE1-2 N-terminal domain-containing protein n=1 Tax=Apatococcus lobatus TaxID=904363 RepID=A0AAW1RW74_9CHLO